MSRVADPDSVGSGVFAWIRIQIRFSNFSVSGSGFQTSLDPDPVSAPGPEAKKECRKCSKSYLLEENFKIMTEDRRKMKKETSSY